MAIFCNNCSSNMLQLEKEFYRLNIDCDIRFKGKRWRGNCCLQTTTGMCTFLFSGDAIGFHKPDGLGFLMTPNL